MGYWKEHGVASSTCLQNHLLLRWRETSHFTAGRSAPVPRRSHRRPCDMRPSPGGRAGGLHCSPHNNRTGSFSRTALASTPGGSAAVLLQGPAGSDDNTESAKTPSGCLRSSAEPDSRATRSGSPVPPLRWSRTHRASFPLVDSKVHRAASAATSPATCRHRARETNADRCCPGGHLRRRSTSSDDTRREGAAIGRTHRRCYIQSIGRHRLQCEPSGNADDAGRPGCWGQVKN